MNKTFFTSDQHFDHEAVIRHSGRPFKCKEEMNEFIIEAHNRVVGEYDHVYHIGDFAWKNHSSFVKRLKGIKHLLIGNHDKMNVEGLSCFDHVNDICQLNIAGIRVVMCHFPMESWWGKGGGAWMLYGHTHRVNLIPNKRFYVGVDARRDFAPWEFEELKELVMDDLPRF